MITFASAREWNHSRLRHSSRNLPLKLSVTPFCQGLPGSINAVPIQEGRGASWERAAKTSGRYRGLGAAR